MNREEAEALGAEALELAREGQWGHLLQLELSAEVIELVRRQSQLNLQIQNLEEQERVLWELTVQQLTNGND